MKYIYPYALFEAENWKEELSEIESDVRNMLLELSDEDFQTSVNNRDQSGEMEIVIGKESDFLDPNKEFYWKDIEDVVTRIYNYVNGHHDFGWRIVLYIDHHSIKYNSGVWESTDASHPNAPYLFKTPMSKLQIYID